MKDTSTDFEEESPYECFDCGSIIIAEDQPGKCPDCGGAMRNRRTPLE